MLNSIVLSAILISMASVTTARAESFMNTRSDRYRCNYPSAVSTITNETNDGLGPCLLDPLTLTRAPWKSQTVDAWSGGYERTESVTIYYTVNYYDPCSGAWLGSSNGVEDGTRDFTFQITNPNLDPSVKESYVANAPLTDAEAQAELPGLLQACENFQP